MADLRDGMRSQRNNGGNDPPDALHECIRPRAMTCRFFSPRKTLLTVTERKPSRRGQAAARSPVFQRLRIRGPIGYTLS